MLGKNYSDFLGFHVRFLFCITVASGIASIPVTNMLIAWDQGTEYRTSDFTLELLVALVFMLYALVMYGFIIVVGTKYLIGPSPRSRKRIAFGFVAAPVFWVMETAATLGMVYIAVFRLLPLLGVEWNEAECILYLFLEDTGYPIWGDIPARCVV